MSKGNVRPEAGSQMAGRIALAVSRSGLGKSNLSGFYLLNQLLPPRSGQTYRLSAHSAVTPAQLVSRRRPRALPKAPAAVVRCFLTKFPRASPKDELDKQQGKGIDATWYRTGMSTSPRTVLYYVEYHVVTVPCSNDRPDEIHLRQNARHGYERRLYRSTIPPSLLLGGGPQASIQDPHRCSPGDQ